MQTFNVRNNKPIAHPNIKAVQWNEKQYHVSIFIYEIVFKQVLLFNISIET